MHKSMLCNELPIRTVTVADMVMWIYTCIIPNIHVCTATAP